MRRQVAKAKSPPQARQVAQNSESQHKKVQKCKRRIFHIDGILPIDLFVGIYVSNDSNSFLIGWSIIDNRSAELAATAQACTKSFSHHHQNQFWFSIFDLCLRAQNNTTAHYSSNSIRFKLCVSAKTLHILTVHRVYIYIFARTIRYLKAILQNCSLLRAKRTTKFKLSSEAPKSTTSQITIEIIESENQQNLNKEKFSFSDHWIYCIFVILQ